MKTILQFARLGLVCILAPACGAQIIYEAGLRFEDGTVLKSVNVNESVVLEVFLDSGNDSPALTEYLVGLSGSTGPNPADLAFDSANPLPAWDYLNTLTGQISDRSFSAVSAADPIRVFPVVVDVITITPRLGGTYTLAPNPSNFDLLAVDAGDVVGTATQMRLASGFGSVTLTVVPEAPAGVASSLLLMTLAGARVWSRARSRQRG